MFYLKLASNVISGRGKFYISQKKSFSVFLYPIVARCLLGKNDAPTSILIVYNCYNQYVILYGARQARYGNLSYSIIFDE